MKIKVRKRSVLKDDPEAIIARARVLSIIDAIPPDDLVSAIKRAPSLRGMILGYIAEEMFEKHLPAGYSIILAEHIERHDDHDKKFNKSDRTITHDGRMYGIQLKSMQTNSIGRNVEHGYLQADVQNDGSDARTVKFPDETTVITTCYLRGDYDVLAVPLFPFTGKWDFAYKRNLDCRATTSNKYSEYQCSYLLSTTEKITWPLGDAWTMDLLSLLQPPLGRPTNIAELLSEPPSEVRIVELAPMVLPLED